MIQSMTAFARTEEQGDWGKGVCEIRSINHRYLELTVRLPDNLNNLEGALREQIRQSVQRGKIECYIRYSAPEKSEFDIVINTQLVQKISRANETIASVFPSVDSVSTMDILKWPGVLQITELDLELIQKGMAHLLKKALTDLVNMRQREGEKLKALLFQRLEAMKKEIQQVRVRLPKVIQLQRERLVSRFQEIKLTMDETRLEQELLLLSQKVDVAEEIDRLDSHITEVERNLKEGGAIGRRLDFLMQELQREANTLGSKSIDVETTRASVELKVLIEQMREQIQNIE